MPRLFSFLTGTVTGALLTLGAMNFHIVRAQDGFHLIHKIRPQLTEAYLDVRTYGVSDWTGHPDLVADLIHDNKQSLMGGSAANSLQQGAQQLVPSWPQH
ncbi:MAG TPA: hypothetical protein VGM76_10020 [Lacipirellulaceae bacterium]|jgi:hypothetical protein